MDRKTTRQVAEELGYSQARIIQACRVAGVEKLGSQYALTENDIAMVRSVIGKRPSGRPKKEHAE